MERLNWDVQVLQRIRKGSVAAKFAVLFFFFLLLAGIGCFFLLQGYEASYAFLRAKERSLQVARQEMAHHLSPARRPFLQGETEANIKKLLLQLPTEQEMAGLLERVSKIGVASKLSFESFTPMPLVQHPIYIELPISLEVVGRYQQLVLFLKNIAAMPRLVTLHDFAIEGVSIDKENRYSREILAMKMTIKLYRYRAS